MIGKDDSLKITPEALSQAKKEMKQKVCFYPGCNSDKIINAHTIQKNGPLKYLADLVNGQNEVFYLDDDLELDKANGELISKQKIKRRLHSNGIAVASTFNGFCLEHDKIFKNTIEDPVFENSKTQLFYHTYRAQAYCIHKKYEQYKYLESLCSKMKDQNDQLENAKIQLDSKREDFDKLFDGFSNLSDLINNPIHELKEQWNEMSQKTENALEDIALEKSKLNQIILAKDTSSFRYLSLSLKGLYPIACSTVVKYIDNFAMTRDDGIVHPMELNIIIFPVVASSKTYIIISSNKNDTYADLIMNRISNSKPAQNLKFISDLLLHHGYNIFISPRIINKLSPAQMDILINSRAESNSYDIGLPTIDFNLFNPNFKD